MGSGSSSGSCCGYRQSVKSADEGKEVKLSGTKLRFSTDQLRRLNGHLTRLHEQHCSNDGADMSRDRAQAAVQVVVERLVQRLVCGAGNLDRRFSCKFLTSLEPSCSKNPRFHYLVRLDRLSSPAIYPDTYHPTCKVVEGVLGSEGLPQGFAKLRVQGEGADEWAEFINPAGFLRRDKVQERFVELVAQAAARATEPTRPDQVDESVFCGSPGKIVDLGVLETLLRVPADQHVFYGPADCNQSRFPDPRDFRIAIVEGAPEVRLRIGFLSPALESWGRGEGDVEVKLVLGVGCAEWPQSCDFPGRLPLGHIDFLLHHRAAQTGFYLVPGPPHPTVRCDDRTSTWQVWLPGAELQLLTHYSTCSTPGKVLGAVEAVVMQMKGSKSSGSLDQERLKVVSRHMVRTLLWFQLERHVPGPAALLLAWSPHTVSSHVLTLLDSLVVALRTQRFRSYFFPWCNIMLHSASGGHHRSEEEYICDADLLEQFLRSLHDESSSSVMAPPEDVALEAALLRKWRDVLCDLAPPATTRSRRLSFTNTELGYTTAGATQYSPRQLHYIGYLLREMLRVRELTLQSGNSPTWFQGPVPPCAQQEDPVEDLIYLLTTILEQARDQSLGLSPSGTTHRSRKRTSKSNPRRSKNDPSIKFRSSYDSSVALLLEMVRRDVATSSADLSDDAVLVRHVLQWLYKALDEDPRHLAPVLRTYLNTLFAASHEGGWHLDEWRRRDAGAGDETDALATFCRLVVAGEITPVDGLIDAVSKGWTWAESMLEMAEFLANTSEGPVGNGLHLVFTPSPGKVIRYMVALPPTYNFMDHISGGDSRYSTCSSSKSHHHSATNTLKMRKATLRKATTTLPSLILQQSKGYDDKRSPNQPPHCRLRDTSPYTLTVDSQRRYGRHRGLGDVVQALVGLHKFSVLQEISTHLPDGERSQMLDAIQKISKESRRAGAARRAAIKQHVTSSGDRSRGAPSQAYRANSELTGSSKGSRSPSERRRLDRLQVGADTLLGTCRAARSQHRSTVLGGGTSAYNGAMFLEPPVGRGMTLTSPYGGLMFPYDVGLLQLTEDRQLRLASPGELAGSQIQDLCYEDTPVGRKREIVTKL